LSSFKQPQSYLTYEITCGERDWSDLKLFWV
jgi:hypothetical protein